MSIVGWTITIHRTSSFRLAALRWHNVKTQKITEIDLYCGPIFVIISCDAADEF